MCSKWVGVGWLVGWLKYGFGADVQAGWLREIYEINYTIEFDNMNVYVNFIQSVTTKIINTKISSNKMNMYVE